MSTETTSPLHQPDPAAIFAIAQSLWEACQTQTARDPKINLSEAYHGMDQFMRELMRVASQFESWACRYIDFPELAEPWPYLLQDRFGEACLQFKPVTELAAFAEPDSLRVALRLRLPVKRDQGLPVPVDLRADLPSRDGVPGFCAFRIQTIRDELPGPQCAALTWDDDPYDPAFSPPFFGLYGVTAAGLSEHIADRPTLAAALALTHNLVPGLEFGSAPTNLPANLGVRRQVTALQKTGGADLPGRPEFTASACAAPRGVPHPGLRLAIGYFPHPCHPGNPW